MKRKNTQDLQAKRSNNLERQSHWTSIRLFKNNIQKRQQWPHIFKQLKKKENGPRILYPATLAFQYQVYRKSFKHTRAQGISHEWALSEGSILNVLSTHGYTHKMVITWGDGCINQPYFGNHFIKRTYVKSSHCILWNL